MENKLQRKHPTTAGHEPADWATATSQFPQHSVEQLPDQAALNHVNLFNVPRKTYVGIAHAAINKNQNTSSGAELALEPTSM